MMMIFTMNEEKQALNLLLGRDKTIKSCKQKVGLITRYHYNVENMSDEDNYKSTVEWMKRNHPDFYECMYSDFVDNCVKKAHKDSFYNIDAIKITTDELNIIKSLDNIRQQKILFVLVCCAKFQREKDGFTNGFTNFRLIDVYKAARVSVPAEDREYILYQLLKMGLIKKPQKNDSVGLFVTFLSANEDNVAVEINEHNCKELAYLYLSLISDNDKYTTCKKCKCIIKKTKSVVYCKDCADELELAKNGKTILCVDCGKDVNISDFDSKTVRCEQCRHEYIKAYDRNRKRHIPQTLL